MSKQLVTVQIRGREIRIRGSDDEVLLQRVATYLNETMNEVEKRTGTIDSLDVALLTALNLARELVEIREGRRSAPGASLDMKRLRSLIELGESTLQSAAN